MISASEDRAWADQMMRNLIEIEKAIASGKAVEITLHRDADTGKIALIEATVGGKFYQFAEKQSDVRDVSTQPVLVQGRLFYAKAIRDQYGRVVKWTAEGQIDEERPLVFKDASGREHTLTGGRIEAVLDADQRLSSAVVKDAILDGRRFSEEIHFGDDLGRAVWMKAERGIVEREEADIAPFSSTPQTARAFMEGYASAAAAYVQQVKEHGDAALRYQAVMATKAVQDFFKQTGTVTTASRASGGGQIRFSPTESITVGLLEWMFGVDVSASGAVRLSRENAEQIQHDLIYWKIRQIQDEAAKAAIVGGKIDWGIFREVYQEKMHDFWQGINALVEGKDPSQFGASSIAGEPFALFRKYWDEAKGNIVEAYNRWKQHMEQKQKEFYQAIANNEVEKIQKMYPSLTRSQAERFIALMQERMRKGEPLMLSSVEVYRLLNED